MVQSMAFLVAPAGTRERTTNHPLLCWLRPSNRERSPVRLSMIMRCMSDSGACEGRGFDVAVGQPEVGSAGLAGEDAGLCSQRPGLSEQSRRIQLEVEADSADEFRG